MGIVSAGVGKVNAGGRAVRYNSAMATENNVSHEQLMDEAIRQAELARAAGDVPIGAVIARDGEIIAAACNRRHAGKDPTAHAEMNAIREACRKLKTANLSGCEIYATFKPCPMCQAACERANISRIYYGVRPQDFGASPKECKTVITAGFLKNECSELVQGGY